MATHQILATEEMVGAGHGTKADTLNRLINLITAKGDLLRGSAAATAAALAIGTANKKLFVNAAGDDIEWAVGLKVGLISRDTATASGDQAISGVGFKPSAIIFIANVIDTAQISFGLDDGTNHICIGNSNVLVGAFEPDGSSSIVLYESGGTTYAGVVSTLGADGFTITWTKTGSKTGTATILYLAMR